MAERKAKTAGSRRGVSSRKHVCPSCSADTRVVYYTGFGKKGFFWVCDKNCGYSERTR